jgi:hypothetical protein
LSRGPDIWLTPIQGIYFLVTADNPVEVAHRSDDVLTIALGKTRRVFALLSAGAGPEERAAAIREAKERLRTVREHPSAAAKKLLDYLLAAGVVAAQGRRRFSSPYEIIEPIEFSELRLAGSNLVNASRDIVFYNVRLSSRDLDKARRRLLAPDGTARESSPLPNEGVIPRETEGTGLQHWRAGPELAPSPIEGPLEVKRRRGPAKGSIDRYGVADRALFPVLERIRREHQLSLTAAAQKLAEGEIEGERVLGSGTPLSRAKRLVRRYNADRETR